MRAEVQPVQRHYDANKRAFIRQKNIEMITRMMKDFGQSDEESPSNETTEQPNSLRTVLRMWQEMPVD